MVSITDLTALRDRLRVIDTEVNEAIGELNDGIDGLEDECAERDIPPARLEKMIAAFRNGVVNLEGIIRLSGSPAAIRAVTKLADRIDKLEAGDYLGMKQDNVTDLTGGALDGHRQ